MTYRELAEFMLRCGRPKEEVESLVKKQNADWDDEVPRYILYHCKK